MKIGLLGTGFGRAHAAVYAARADVEKVVVFGRTPAELRPLAEEFECEATTDPDEIYGDPDIGLVDVCLPTPLHAEHAVRAMEAGKDVLCELPLAASVEDARRARERAGRPPAHPR
ncbi:Gfo/Idh/MocA family protein [Streptomyces sp. YGL11-2]|uniref:Gfo/Idh/MocA family protein n=1 Tax=Streptomyces sp. YGL11-2 TaxID=3414028 RepID=UPI003CEAA23B